jgi:hypothetical protein
MKLLRLKGGQNYFVTEDEASYVAEKIATKGVAFLRRLDNLMVSEFQLEYFGPMIQDFVGKEIFADADGIFYCNDGNDWYFWHLLPTPEQYRSSMDKYKEAMDYITNQNNRINPKQDCLPELRNRAWVRVGEYDEVAVIPVDEYLRLKFTNNSALETIRDVRLLAVGENNNLPVIISSGVKLIGTDKRLAREKYQRKRHLLKIEEFRRMSMEEKINTYYELGWIWRGREEFADEFKEVFFEMHKKKMEDCKNLSNDAF